ncbi:MAG: hypothetical protein O7G88_06955 [bacterium]|nr:hypothetical protein [bacterium]
MPQEFSESAGDELEQRLRKLKHSPFELATFIYPHAQALDPTYPLFQLTLAALRANPVIRIVTAEEGLDLKTALGMPLDALIVVMSVDGPLGWPDYVFFLFGTYLLATPDSEDAPIFRLCEHRPGHKAQEVELVAWLRHVSHCDFPAFVEARWHPTMGEKVSLQGLEGLAHKDAEQVLRGLQLLRKIERRGRPSGSTAWGKKELMDAMTQAKQRLVARGVRPTQENVADKIGMSDRTLRNYLKQFNIPWTRPKTGKK